VVAALLKGGKDPTKPNCADVNHTDCDGQTALMYAGSNNHAEVVRVLVNARADINLRDNDGRTALDITRSCYNIRICHGRNHDNIDEIIRIIEESIR
jgi:ankyrin repeat protein